MNKPYNNPGTLELDELTNKIKSINKELNNEKFNWYLATENFFREPEEITKAPIIK